jgi:predicted site-specific integrase-resolvase
MKQPYKNWLSTERAARMAGVDERTIRRWSAQGKLTKYYKRHNVYYRKSDIKKLVTINKHKRARLY